MVAFRLGFEIYPPRRTGLPAAGRFDFCDLVLMLCNQSRQVSGELLLTLE
jgi:hypothetical protein